MAEIVAISLITPIVKKGVIKLVKWALNRRKEKKQAERISDMVAEKLEAQREVEIEVKGPNYGGYSNHWIEHLHAANETQDVNYSYLGNEINTQVEKNQGLAVLKLDIPNMNKDLLREAVMKDYWNIQNDKNHGNGVMTMALPQETTAKVQDEVVTFTAEGLGSVPINGRYIFNKEITGFQFNKEDPNPEDFYKAGRLEIPVELIESDYQIYPVSPPAPKIPDYAIRRPHFTEEVIKDVSEVVKTQPFIYCPLCGAKNTTGGNPIKFCMICGKNIEKYVS